MKKLIIFLLLTIISIGCKEESVSIEQNQPKSIEITDFQKVEICHKVLDPKNPPNIPEFFTSDSLYHAVLDPIACTTLPYIDFSKRTLIYTWISDSKPPHVSITFKGSRNDSTKVYSIVVETKSPELVDPVAVTKHLWYTIPKILPGYTVKSEQVVVP